ncbi:MAG: phospho-sugar mutase [Micrococcaceae bacterium]
MTNLTPKQWIELDPDAQTKAELQELVEKAETDQDAQKELDDRFSGFLEFGTAGLRAEMAAGPNRMNRLVVRKAAAGLANYAKSKLGAKDKSVAIGYDGRHNSKIFAKESAQIMTAAGIKTYLMPRELPTPVLASSVRKLKTDIGIMVTASHNPAADNGYKVYLGNQLTDELGNGSQIVPPADKEISEEIDAIDLSKIELADSGWEEVPESIITDYVERAASLVNKADFHKDLKIVYTAMHGVGSPVIRAVLEKTGFEQVAVVKEQDNPDPNFPTVSFPNPEEKGALSLAIATAKEENADIILAHDPDADRAAIALEKDGQWIMFRGDQLGTLLGWRLLAHTEDPTKLVLSNSIVSSRMLGVISKDYGAEHHETLTGFKWIPRLKGFSYGYEEALGYCTDPDYVHDKDGTSALLFAAHMAAFTKSKGTDLWGTLDKLYTKYGLYSSDQLSIRVTELSQIQDMMKQLRSEPLTTIAGSKVTESRDLLKPTNNLPPTDGLAYYCEDGTRVIIRPSGTEPKLKCYLEVITDSKDGSLDTARETAAKQLDEIKTELSKVLGV